MGLRYELPKVGELLSEKELTMLAESNGYRVVKAGDRVDGGMLITLWQGGCLSMSFLLVDGEKEEEYKRVF